MIFVPALLELVPELKGRTSKRERKTLQVLQILSSVTLTVNQVINCLKLSTCSQTMSHSCLCISLYFCADRYLKKMIKKSTFLLDKYKLVYPEIQLGAFIWALILVCERPARLRSEEPDQGDGEWREQNGGGGQGEEGRQALREAGQGNSDWLLIFTWQSIEFTTFRRGGRRC